MAGLLFSVVGKDYPARLLSYQDSYPSVSGGWAIAQDFYGSNRWQQCYKS
ncbi:MULTISPECIES: hypothetical protein [unclassified Thermosynechococcus]|nr:MULTISPECIES: hypothetical protein [unclassified Thermosynechococcus]MDR7920725.1 hypothetical protein [Thermosynechococcus sp. HY213]WNC22426.1 hypothetical protein RHG98_00740 [Thermosynechococcus sp. PP22]WNC32665.1 hypothetical protein RHH81_00760 [Thermosynechococcus sp. PKX95]WNC35194.1 hypothetical protein RHH79_00760 [Thermosynechococcus sp. PKX91]WNC37712.1 hypothetical protein RHI11_00765 [Thermosynechococcus sp. WL11]